MYALRERQAGRLKHTPLHFERSQAKARVEFTAVVCATTGKARDGTAYPADARKFLSAIWAPINEARHVSSCWEREIVAALFIRDFQIATRLLPLLAMRKNPAPARAKLREDVGEFMPQRAIDFWWMVEQP